MTVDLLEWVKYLALTVACGLTLAGLCWFFYWIFKQWAKVKGGYFEAKQARVIGPIFRKWLREELKTNKDLQELMPKSKYPDYYEG